MSNLRIGQIFTQDTLHAVTQAVQEPIVDQSEFGRKVHALRKFLQHGMSRFSIETLQHVLSGLVESITRHEGHTTTGFSSLQEVRAAVKTCVMLQDTSHFRVSEVDGLKYLESFFYCVFCLSEARRLFQQVYSELHVSYYDPDTPEYVSRQSTYVHTTDPRLKAEPGSDHYDQFGIWTLDQMTGSTQLKLKQTVTDMRQVLDRWTSLLTEDVTSMDSFEPESEQDLLRLHGAASGLEPVLRLVPDMFAKFYKCMELAKQWWAIAHEIYPDLPFNRPTEVGSEVSGNVSLRESVSSEDSADVRTNETPRSEQIEVNEVMETLNVIHLLQEEIKVLQGQEDKIEILVETFNRVSKDIEKDRAVLKGLRMDQEHARAKGIPHELAQIEVQIHSKESNIRLLEFQLSLLYDDYAVHLELRPSIIRFLDGAKTKLNEAQATLTMVQNGHESTTDTDDGFLSTPFVGNEIQPPTRRLFRSEYSLQSIERGVQAVTERCTEFSHEKSDSIVRKRKQSLNKVNSRQSLNGAIDTKTTRKQPQNSSIPHTSAQEASSDSDEQKKSAKRQSMNAAKELKLRALNSSSGLTTTGSRKSQIETNDNRRQTPKSETGTENVTKRAAAKRLENAEIIKSTPNKKSPNTLNEKQDQSITAVKDRPIKETQDQRIKDTTSGNLSQINKSPVKQKNTTKLMDQTNKDSQTKSAQPKTVRPSTVTILSKRSSSSPKHSPGTLAPEPQPNPTPHPTPNPVPHPPSRPPRLDLSGVGRKPTPIKRNVR